MGKGPVQLFYRNTLGEISGLIDIATGQATRVVDGGSFDGATILAPTFVPGKEALSFTVSERTREFGVRMALGARGPDVIAMVLRHGLALAAAGLIPGVVTAYWAGRGMQAVLFGVPPADGLTFGVVIALCLTMAVAGCLAPALRAVRVDPVRAIKAD